MLPQDIRNNHRGFTLLEVMIALAIFAVAALVILEQSSRSVRGQARLVDRTIATYVAENQIEKLRLQKRSASTGTRDDSIQMAGREWYVRTEIQETSVKRFLKVIVSVRSEPEQENPVTTLTGYLGDQK